MPTFFHVDRTGALQAGQVLSLQRLDQLPSTNKIPEPALQQHAEAFLPEGLSKHGMAYLYWQRNTVVPVVAGTYDEPALASIRSHAIDLVWELIRRGDYPHLPSRYQATFCWDSHADATRFASAMGATNVAIWEIEGKERFRADMNLLAMQTALDGTLAAHRYWRGEAHPTKPPHWEVFLKPGAKVGHRVT